MFTNRKIPKQLAFLHVDISVPVATDSSVQFPDGFPASSRGQPTALQKPTKSRCTGMLAQPTYTTWSVYGTLRMLLALLAKTRFGHC